MCATEVSVLFGSIDLGGFSTVFFHRKSENIVECQDLLSKGEENMETEDEALLKSEKENVVDILDVSQPVHVPQRWFFPANSLGDFVWNSVRGVGKGIENVANTCFLNATVQALAYCTPFAQDCLKGRHAARCERRQNKQLCGFCYFEHHIQQLLNVEKGKKNILHWPTPLLQLMKKEIRMNQGRGNWYGSQNCAHEWLVQFFDFLIMYDLPMELKQDFQNGRIPPYDLSTVYLYQLFSFLLEESKICCSCHKKTTRYELNTCVRVPLSGSRSVEKALKATFEPEMLTESNQPLCESCGIPRDKKACRGVHRPPNILILLLQRTQYHSYLSHPYHKHRSISKNNLHMDIPLTLSLEPYMTSTYISLDKTSMSCNNEYNFLASVNHSGTAGFGHYWAIVKGPDGQFYKFDDELRSRVSRSTLSEQLASAYLLFYLRKSPVVFDTSSKNDLKALSNSSLSVFALTLCSAFLSQPQRQSFLKKANSLDILGVGTGFRVQKQGNCSISERTQNSTPVVYKKRFSTSLVKLHQRYRKHSRSLRHLQQCVVFSKILKNNLQSKPKIMSREFPTNISTGDLLQTSQYQANKSMYPHMDSVVSESPSSESRNSFDIVLVHSPDKRSKKALKRSKTLNAEQRLSQCKNTFSQYGYQITPVMFWEDSDTAEDLQQSVKDFREKIQRSLLPKTTRRTRNDLDYDRGRQKKIKKHKKRNTFNFGAAINTQKLKNKPINS